jgi:hypothetical protein
MYTTCNSNKTVCIVFNPTDRNKIILRMSPPLTLGIMQLQYVDDYTDDRGISREICNIFVGTNILVRRFSRCSKDVKVALFKTYCRCVYDPTL